jgi:hypothetical protein
MIPDIAAHLAEENPIGPGSVYQDNPQEEQRANQQKGLRRLALNRAECRQAWSLPAISWRPERLEPRRCGDAADVDNDLDDSFFSMADRRLDGCRARGPMLNPALAHDAPATFQSRPGQRALYFAHC